MRMIFLTTLIVGTMGFFSMSISSAAPANGAAIDQAAQQADQTMLVAGGCGRGRHRGPHGGCVPN
jgi:hypothetical protein